MNSVAGVVPENIPPTVENLDIQGEFEIKLTFSEKMDLNSVLLPSAYLFTPNLEVEEVIQGVENEIIIFLSESVELINFRHHC